MTLQAILYHPATSRYSPPTLEVLDQLLLPHTTRYVPIFNAGEAFYAIKSMRVRGAPAIAIVAALAVSVEYSGNLLAGSFSDASSELVAALMTKTLDILLHSRPTAVNLSDAVTKLKAVVSKASLDGRGAVDGGEQVVRAYVKAAEQMLADDMKDNKAIGEHGAEWILRHASKAKGGKVSILTHCNTGSLATSGYGTALGVIRHLHASSALHRAYFTETRPYNQGSRLTAYELLHDGIPSTLITDSMAASLLALRGSPSDENIAAVVVGADRVAANGDTANKIGTYALAILARYHGVKFLVAAPRTTIDLKTASGKDIMIEERAGHEVTSIRGVRYDELGEVVGGDGKEPVTVSVAAEGVHVWNPAFDVTPAELIDGIVTERGVVEKDGPGRFDLRETA